VADGVFLNYRGEDSRSYAALLYMELSRHFGNELVFLDSESMVAGTDFVDELVSQVRHCRAMLAIIGPRWLHAAEPRSGRRRIDNPQDWIRRELVTAIGAGVRVIPILTDDAELPQAEDLPDDLVPLIRYQFRRLRHREATADLARIIADLEAVEPGLASAARQLAADTVQNRVGDRLRQETARVLGVLDRARFPLVVPGLDPDEVPALVEQRLDAYQRELAGLIGLVADCVTAGPEWDQTWLRSLRQLLATADDDRDAVEELATAQAYPALLVSYAAGVAAVLAGRETAVPAMLDPTGSATGAGRWAIKRLLPYRVVAPVVVAGFPGWPGRPPEFGLSLRLRRVLEAVFARTGDRSEFAAAFEEYEYLRSLLELHSLDFTAFGEFAVALGRDRSDLDERTAPWLTAGSPLLRAGAFNGQAAAATETRRRLVSASRARFG